jgi:hypothetical protein
MAANTTGTNTWRDSEGRGWAEWDRIQQELRGGVEPWSPWTMSERWGLPHPTIHDIVDSALKKCRQHKNADSFIKRRRDQT